MGHRIFDKEKFEVERKKFNLDKGSMGWIYKAIERAGLTPPKDAGEDDIMPEECILHIR